MPVGRRKTNKIMENLIKVQIRVFKGEPLAIFPYEIEGSNTVLCYSHIGQHSAMAWDLKTKPANEWQINNLLCELKNQGYTNLSLIHKRNHKEYLKAYYKWVNSL